MSRWLAASPVTSSSPNRIRPDDGFWNPAIMRSVVVLPQPEEPSSVRNSPGLTSRSRFFTAVMSPRRSW